MFHTVKIEKIITGGIGLGRLADGQVVLTRHVLPGETVRVKEQFLHRGYIEALPVDIITPSRHRISSPCPYYQACGGCDLQHIDPVFQNHVKTEIVRESIDRAGVSTDITTFHPIIPAPQPFQYRYRIRVQVSPSGELGFYQTASNNLVPIDRCLLATENINQSLLELNCSEFTQKIAAYCSEIEIQQSPSGDTIFTILYLRRNLKIPPKQLNIRTASFDTSNNLLIKKGKKLITADGKPPKAVMSQEFDIDSIPRPYLLQWSPGCFFQVNIRQNNNIITQVIHAFSRFDSKKVLELYCGMGNFSIPLALAGAEITGVEQNPESIRWADLNARQAGLDTCVFHADDVVRSIKQLVQKNIKFDVVLLDPPRQGLGKATDFLVRTQAKNVIYVSCDPATLARDIVHLNKSGYNLTDVTPIDMFPQTHHIETVALLEKN